MPGPANYKQVLAQFADKPEGIRNFFGSFPELVERYDWDVSVSYVFTRVEIAKRSTLYCGIVKRHWTDAKMTRDALDRDHMSRGRFRELFKMVFGSNIPAALLEKLAAGESVRDKVAHGKWLEPAQARQGLVEIFDFSNQFNTHMTQLAGFAPFGSLKGFKGRAESLPKQTTHWVLKGMGIGSGAAPRAEA